MSHMKSKVAPSDSSLHLLGEADPERAFHLKQCLDLLLAGGYFRARLPSDSVSNFDKVIGGMAWSLTASGGDDSGSNLDFDLVTFRENSTLGQRIRLSDRICKALVRMKCPHPLEAHQIQGLDYEHLFPVLQWLVRKVIEHRSVTGNRVRMQSLENFRKNYHSQKLLGKFDLEQESKQQAPLSPSPVSPTTSTITSPFSPSSTGTAPVTRKFKKKTDARFDSVLSRY
jgi:hypothetical protein